MKVKIANRSRYLISLVDGLPILPLVLNEDTEKLPGSPSDLALRRP